MRLRLCLILALAASACTSAPPAQTATVTSESSPTRRPTPRATAPASPTSAPTSPSCREKPGTIQVSEYLDDDLPRSIPFRIYLPACYEETHPEPLPVLLLLHGLQATDQQWQDLGVAAAADRLIAAGEVPPFLIVMPWERRGLEFETALVEHLLPHIQADFRGTRERSRLAIGGLSRGAGWAMRIGLKHAHVFGSVGLHSPAVLAPDLYYVPQWVDTIQEDGRPRLWIDIGDHDSLRASVFELKEVLDGLEYEYRWTFDPGDHTAEYWFSHLEAYLLWYTEFW
ncbi:MAG TPA: alpha/beta hydrolase-fold protein [Anaerolineales bacterium]|nr:alpha/beta hydrolase-fold protein [Anaerolineales bacterium]